MDRIAEAGVDPTALAQRIAGFVAHLRLNHFAVGPAETAAALALAHHIEACDPLQARLGLRTLLAGRQQDWERFDDVFEAYWLGRGIVRSRPSSPATSTAASSRPQLWQRHLPQSEGVQDPLPQIAGTEDQSDDTSARKARLVASKHQSLTTKDLRHIVDPDELAAAEQLAGRLARAMRYRLSRRFRISNRGRRLDLRRSLRRNLSRGGDPIELIWRRRVDRPVRIVVLLDVSGSMQQYSRFFLQFTRGLVGSWAEADAYLFHTRLLRVTHVLRDKDPIRAMTKLSLMAQGFGGGTRIGEAVRVFNDRYAKTTLNSRTVVVVLSDGYDTGEVDDLVGQLRRLRRKARRLVWLNPLLGWQRYQPVARAMFAALPYVDHFASAHSLEALAALEGTFERL